MVTERSHFGSLAIKDEEALYRQLAANSEFIITGTGNPRVDQSVDSMYCNPLNSQFQYEQAQTTYAI